MSAAASRITPAKTLHERVLHLMGRDRIEPATLTNGGRVQPSGTVVYPACDPALAALNAARAGLTDSRVDGPPRILSVRAASIGRHH